MEEIIGLLTDSNGNHVVGEGDIRDAIILIKDMYAENTSLRAIVKEVERFVSLVGMIDGHADGWEWQLIKRHVESLQAALDKINETGQHV